MQGKSSMQGRYFETGREKISIGVEIVSKHAGSGDNQGLAVVRGVGVIETGRRPVAPDFAERQADGCNRGGVAAVGGAVAETVHPMKRGLRRINERAISIQLERAVLRPADEHRYKRV